MTTPTLASSAPRTVPVSPHSRKNASRRTDARVMTCQFRIHREFPVAERRNGGEETENTSVFQPCREALPLLGGEGGQKPTIAMKLFKHLNVFEINLHVLAAVLLQSDPAFRPARIVAQFRSAIAVDLHGNPSAVRRNGHGVPLVRLEPFFHLFSGRLDHPR